MAASSSRFFLNGYGELYSSSNWCYHFNNGLQERKSDSILDWQLLMKCLKKFASQSFALWVNITLRYDRRELYKQLKDITKQLKVSLYNYRSIAYFYCLPLEDAQMSIKHLTTCEKNGTVSVGE